MARRAGLPGQGGGAEGGEERLWEDRRETEARAAKGEVRRAEATSAVLMATGTDVQTQPWCRRKSPRKASSGPHAASGQLSRAHIQARRTPYKIRTHRRGSPPAPI